MIKQKVFVFNGYVEIEDKKYYSNLGLRDSDLFAYHNQLLDKDGYVKPCRLQNHLNPIKPLMRNVITKTKYELDKEEQRRLNRINTKINLATKLLDNLEKEKYNFEDAILDKVFDDFPDIDIFDGEHWECSLSPIGRCLYKYEDEESVCIFCGESEERK